MANGSGGRSIGIWVLTVLLAALFLFAGGMKLSSAEQIASDFGRFGYPVWFSYIVGLVEVGGALLLFSARTAAYAAGALIVIMAGALYSHLSAGDSAGQIMTPVVVGLLLGVIAFTQRPARV
jgi:uncharacterized membrane protein YphA (DoxX/SURF4 family)